MTTYIQLKRGCDWAHDYLAIEPLDQHGTADCSRGIKLADGVKVDAMFPDGTEMKVTIVNKKFTGSYLEQGQFSSTHVDFVIPGFELNTHGIKAWLPLDTEGLLVNRSCKGIK